MKRELARADYPTCRASYKRELSYSKLEKSMNSRPAALSPGSDLFEGGKLTPRFQEMVAGLIQERRELYERLAGGA